MIISTGGFVCLGQFLHQFLAGSQIGYPYASLSMSRYFVFSELHIVHSGFQSTSRANPLAQKILAADIALGNTDFLTFYSPDNCKNS